MGIFSEGLEKFLAKVTVVGVVSHCIMACASNGKSFPYPCPWLMKRGARSVGPPKVNHPRWHRHPLPIRQHFMVEFSLGFLNGSVQHNSFFSNRLFLVEADQAFAVIFKAKAPWWDWPVDKVKVYGTHVGTAASIHLLRDPSAS